MREVLWVVICFVPAATVAVASAAPQTDKSEYTLFNPTPRELMRAMSADRPDATESPYTVDAGRFQLEMSFLTYSREDDDEDAERDTWSFGNMNLKVGLLNNVDLQMLFDAWTQEDVDFDAGGGETIEGFSDVTLRLKVNLWGNDPGPDDATAFAVMPYVKIPTDTEVSNGEWEGGVIGSLGWSVAEDISLGFMGEIDLVHDEEDDDHDLEFLHTAVLGFSLTEPLGAYVEYIGVVPTDSGSDYRASFSTGLTYALRKDVILDGGVVVGLNDAAEDLAVFSGISIRF